VNVLDDLIRLAPQMPELSLAEIPYARHLQLFARKDARGLMLRMHYHDGLIGAPIPPRLHGGTVGGMMEITCALTVALARGPVPEGASPFPKPINITIDYLRAGGVHDVFARAEVLRIGKNIANARAIAWQEDEARVIASAHMNLLMI
jgi:acyl-coenzyme A thioesterase PaaI-like protein